MSEPTRREFVLASADTLKGGWLLLHLPALGVLAACAREAAERGDGFQVFTPAEGETMAALARRILPADDRLPGAEEAGAVHFADAALLRFFPEWTEPVRDFLREVEPEEGPGSFARLPPEAQDAVIREREEDSAFELVRTLVVMGTFSEPHHGGNREGAGWRILDIRPQPAWVPPFGAYDAGANGRVGESAVGGDEDRGGEGPAPASREGGS